MGLWRHLDKVLYWVLEAIQDKKVRSFVSSGDDMMQKRDRTEPVVVFCHHDCRCLLCLMLRNIYNYYYPQKNRWKYHEKD